MLTPDTRYYVVIGDCVIVGLRDTAAEAEELVRVCERQGLLATVVMPGPGGDSAGRYAKPPPGTP